MEKNQRVDVVRLPSEMNYLGHYPAFNVLNVLVRCKFCDLSLIPQALMGHINRCEKISKEEERQSEELEQNYTSSIDPDCKTISRDTNCNYKRPNTDIDPFEKYLKQDKHHSNELELDYQLIDGYNEKTIGKATNFKYKYKRPNTDIDRCLINSNESKSHSIEMEQNYTSNIGPDGKPVGKATNYKYKRPNTDIDMDDYKYNPDSDNFVLCKYCGNKVKLSYLNAHLEQSHGLYTSSNNSGSSFPVVNSFVPSEVETSSSNSSPIWESDKNNVYDSCLSSSSSNSVNIVRLKQEKPKYRQKNNVIPIQYLLSDPNKKLGKSFQEPTYVQQKSLSPQPISSPLEHVPSSQISTVLPMDITSCVPNTCSMSDALFECQPCFETVQPSTSVQESSSENVKSKLSLIIRRVSKQNRTAVRRVPVEKENNSRTDNLRCFIVSEGDGRPQNKHLDSEENYQEESQIPPNRKTSKQSDSGGNMSLLEKKTSKYFDSEEPIQNLKTLKHLAPKEGIQPQNIKLPKHLVSKEDTRPESMKIPKQIKKKICDDLETKGKQMAKRNEHIRASEQQIEFLTGRIELLNRQIETLTGQVGPLRLENEEYKAEIRNLRCRVEELESNTNSLIEQRNLRAKHDKKIEELKQSWERERFHFTQHLEELQTELSDYKNSSSLEKQKLTILNAYLERKFGLQEALTENFQKEKEILERHIPPNVQYQLVMNELVDIQRSRSVIYTLLNGSLDCHLNNPSTIAFPNVTVEQLPLSNRQIVDMHGYLPLDSASTEMSPGSNGQLINMFNLSDNKIQYQGFSDKVSNVKEIDLKEEGTSNEGNDIS